jgi:hypothetical protein
MKVKNISKRTWQHSYMDEKKELHIIELNPGCVNDIPDDVAKKWLLSGEVIEYVDPEDAKALIEEIEKLKAEKAALEEEETKEKSLDELKKEADELGISYAQNIGVKKLQEKIDLAKKEN